MFNLTYMIENMNIKREVELFMQQHFPEEKVVDYDASKQSSKNLIFIEVNDEQVMKRISILVEKLKADSIPFEFVFISKIDSMVFKLLVFKPLYYLRESMLIEDLHTLKTLIRENLVTNSMITVKSGNAIVRLNVDNILFIESFGHYVVIHTPYAQYKIRDKISSFQSKVNKANFIRTHKSYIVNLEFVDKIYNDYITLVGAQNEIPVSRNFRKSVIDKFNFISS